MAAVSQVSPAFHRERHLPPDPTAGRLQVLATEHYSLLATRTLTYTESFSRVSMFLSILSGALIALALFAQVDHFHQTFLVAGALILSVVAFAGIATIGRLGALNNEDLLSVIGMNRLRRAYLDLYPELEPYFVTGSSDDLRGIAQTLGVDIDTRPSPLTIAGHSVQALPAMLLVIVAVVAGVLGASIALLLGAPRVLTGAVAAVVFVATNVGLGLLIERKNLALVRTIPTRFKSPEQ